MFYLEKLQLYFSQILVINTLDHDPELGPDSLEIKSGFNAITLTQSITKALAEFLLSQIDFSLIFCYHKNSKGNQM